MFSRLLQKGLFKERWSLAKRHLKQNYCHACHTRFAVFFPLPSCCVSSLLTEGQRHTLDLKGCQCNSTKTYITCINKKNFRMMENKFIIITKRYYIYCKKSFNRNKINVCTRLIKLPSLSQKDIYHGGPIHTEMRLLLFFLSPWLQNKSGVPFYESQGRDLEQKVFEGLYCYTVKKVSGLHPWSTWLF